MKTTTIAKFTVRHAPRPTDTDDSDGVARVAIVDREGTRSVTVNDGPLRSEARLGGVTITPEG